MAQPSANVHARNNEVLFDPVYGFRRHFVGTSGLSGSRTDRPQATHETSETWPLDFDAPVIGRPAQIFPVLRRQRPLDDSPDYKSKKYSQHTDHHTPNDIETPE
jgi:hypothetical protein